MLEPRVRAELWLGRQLTLTATAGHDLIVGGDTIAVGLALHLSPYDGL
jgi:hypothetical protein